MAVLPILCNDHLHYLGNSGGAARFGDLETFGLLFEPLGDQYFHLGTLKFGYFFGNFSKFV